MLLVVVVVVVVVVVSLTYPILQMLTKIQTLVAKVLNTIGGKKVQVIKPATIEKFGQSYAKHATLENFEDCLVFVHYLTFEKNFKSKYFVEESTRDHVDKVAKEVFGWSNEKSKEEQGKLYELLKNINRRWVINYTTDEDEKHERDDIVSYRVAAKKSIVISKEQQKSSQSDIRENRALFLKKIEEQTKAEILKKIEDLTKAEKSKSSSSSASSSSSSSSPSTNFTQRIEQLKKVALSLYPQDNICDKVYLFRVDVFNQINGQLDDEHKYNRLNKYQASRFWQDLKLVCDVTLSNNRRKHKDTKKREKTVYFGKHNKN